MDFDPQDLIGKHVRLWPYSPSVHNKDALVTLCREMNSVNAGYRVFWAYAREEGQDTLDLTFGLGYFEKTILLLVQHLESGGLVGACWFDDVYPTHRANYNMWFRRCAWGEPAREASTLATQYGFRAFEFDTLWGFTPWPLALRHGLKLGWKHIATLPRYACVRGEPMDVYIVMKENDLWRSTQ